MDSLEAGRKMCTQLWPTEDFKKAIGKTGAKKTRNNDCQKYHFRHHRHNLRIDDKWPKRIADWTSMDPLEAGKKDGETAMTNRRRNWYQKDVVQ